MWAGLINAEANAAVKQRHLCHKHSHTDGLLDCWNGSFYVAGTMSGVTAELRLCGRVGYETVASVASQPPRIKALYKSSLFTMPQSTHNPNSSLQLRARETVSGQRGVG